MQAHEWTANPAGVVHGGFTSTLLDTVLTLAVQAMLRGDRMATTVDLHVHMVRPALPNGKQLTTAPVPSRLLPSPSASEAARL